MPISQKIKPVKKLGQAFLRDERVLQRIVASAQISRTDTVVEIGSGSGNLTKYLVEKAKFVYAVERDAGLCKIAEANLAAFKNVEIVCGDILKINLQDWGNLKVVGNLPYYITTPIIFKLLEQKRYIDDIIIMVQKEVARRIVAKPGGKDYGILSCVVQFYARPEILFDINKGAFWPQPKVDSALMRLRPSRQPAVGVKDEEQFLKVIKAAFGRRRKMLANSLSGKSGLGLAKEDVEKILRRVRVDPKRRAETLSLDEFARITNFYCSMTIL
jgi:16S rRNA (adenine1518-N6/adenine1519-N6)-dimethyltransferase